MYGQGNGVTKVVPPVLGAAAIGVLPQTGMNDVVQIALALAAGLIIWGVVYVVSHKFGKR